MKCFLIILGFAVIWAIPLLYIKQMKALYKEEQERFLNAELEEDQADSTKEE